MSISLLLFSIVILNILIITGRKIRKGYDNCKEGARYITSQWYDRFFFLKKKKSNKLLELIREFIEFVNTLSHYRNKDYDVGVI